MLGLFWKFYSDSVGPEPFVQRDDGRSIITVVGIGVVALPSGILASGFLLSFVLLFPNLVINESEIEEFLNDLYNNIDDPIIKDFAFDGYLNLKKDLSRDNQKISDLDSIKNKSIDWATKIVEDLDYIGTLCVEFFIDKNNNLYANEIAPRVHNSGHLTINTHNISQFENHIRAVCGLEKVETKKIHNGKMLNLIGSEISNFRNKSFKDNEFFYDYLKTEIRDKRKMGHLTIIEK